MKLRPPPPRFPIPESSVDLPDPWLEGRKIRSQPYSDEEVVVSLSNSLKQREQEIRQERSLLGRFLANFLEPQDSETIVVDGIRLKHLYNLARTRPTVELAADDDYPVALENLRDLLNRAKKWVQPSQPPSSHWYRESR